MKTRFNRDKIIAMVLEDYLERNKRLPWGMIPQKSRDLLETIEEMIEEYRTGQRFTVPLIPTVEMHAAGLAITEKRLAPSWTALEVYKAMVKNNVPTN